MKKPSFFERLSGSIGDDGYGDVFEDEHEALPPVGQKERDPAGAMGNLSRALRPSQAGPTTQQHATNQDKAIEQDAEVGELAVDVYQTPEHVVVKALVAGVVPANLDIAVTREMVTIRGSREDEREVEDDNYFQQELYWGPFARTILLPEEVDVDQAEAVEKHGILMIRLPKINKARQTKLRVRSK